MSREVSAWICGDGNPFAAEIRVLQIARRERGVLQAGGSYLHGLRQILADRSKSVCAYGPRRRWHRHRRPGTIYIEPRLQFGHPHSLSLVSSPLHDRNEAHRAARVARQSRRRLYRPRLYGQRVCSSFSCIAVRPMCIDTDRLIVRTTRNARAPKSFGRTGLVSTFLRYAAASSSPEQFSLRHLRPIRSRE